MTNTAREMGVQTASAIVHELTRAVERLSNAIPLLAERIERPMLTRTLTVPSDAVDNVYVQLTTAIRERDEKSAEVAKLQSELTGARVSSGRFQQELAEVELERSGWKASAEKWQHANRDAHRWLGGRDDEMLGDVSRRVAETLRDLSLRVPELERERDEARASEKALIAERTELVSKLGDGENALNALQAEVQRLHAQAGLAREERDLAHANVLAYRQERDAHHARVRDERDRLFENHAQREKEAEAYRNEIERLRAIEVNRDALERDCQKLKAEMEALRKRMVTLLGSVVNEVMGG